MIILRKVLKNLKQKMQKTTKEKAFLSMLVVLAVGFGIVAPKLLASNITQLNQVINGGTLTADTRDASRNPVASPSFTMSSTNLSFDCQNSTGTVGSNSQRLYVDNPDVADNGWTLTLAATAGPTAQWQNGGNTQQYDFNDSTSTGCTDGGDSDSRAGQMTVDANGGTLTADCSSCDTSNITKGSSTGFEQGSVDSVTLLNAAASSNDVGRWYLTGVGIDQTIPAEQAEDSYTLQMTITVTAS